MMQSEAAAAHGVEAGGEVSRGRKRVSVPPDPKRHRR